ncbi:methionine/alanine import family NSS transporter small subunit [Glutamicibacter uratoxydans]
MSGIAITLMIVAMVTIWGGLVLALINLNRHPDVPDDPEDDLLEAPHRL